MSFRSATYTVHGTPIPLLRAVPNHHIRKMWDSQKNLKFYWKSLIDSMHEDRPMFEGPLFLEAFSFIDIPITKRKQAHLLENTLHSSPPDMSNMLKWLEDVAQGVLFKNDCSIAKISTIKLWSVTPRTVFRITELDPNKQYDLKELGI